MLLVLLVLLLLRLVVNNLLKFSLTFSFCRSVMLLIGCCSCGSCCCNLVLLHLVKQVLLSAAL